MYILQVSIRPKNEQSFFLNEIGQILTVCKRSKKPPQRQWCFHEFFFPFVLKKEEAACAWSFKTDMMWILRVQTCSSGARARAAVWQYRLWNLEFGDTKSIKKSQVLKFFQCLDSLLHTKRRGVYHFPVWWIHYSGYSESTGQETGKCHYCAQTWLFFRFS